MLAKARYFLLFFILLFIVTFIVLSDNRFASNKTLESAGQIITIIMVLSILVNLILTVVSVAGKMRQQPQKVMETKSPSEEKNVRIKKLIGRLLLLWLLVIFPLVGASRMVTLSKLSEGGGGTFLGTILFFIMATIGTIIPGLYLSPLIFCVFPLFLFSFYFISSNRWHKWRDPIFSFFVFVLLVLQIWGFILLMKP